MTRAAAFVALGAALVACSQASPWVAPEDAGTLCTTESWMDVELEEGLRTYACVTPPLPAWADPLAACEVFALPAVDSACFAGDGLTLADPRQTASVTRALGVEPRASPTVCRVPLSAGRAALGASAWLAGPWPGCARGIVAEMPVDLIVRGRADVFVRCTSPCQ